MKTIILFFCLLTHAYAEIIKDEISDLKKVDFTFNEVCEFVTGKNPEIVDVKNATTLDCMGTPASIGEYCHQRNMENMNYIRAVIVKEKKKVQCWSASKVVFKMTCESELEKKLCKDPIQGCMHIHDTLVTNHTIVKSYMTEDTKHKELNCLFQSPIQPGQSFP